MTGRLQLDDCLMTDVSWPDLLVGVIFCHFMRHT